MDYIYSQRQMENAVLLAADLYNRLYESGTVGGDSSRVTQTIIQEACNMETWLEHKYGHDDGEYLDHIEEYERMLEEKYGLRLQKVTEPSDTEFFSIEPDGHGGKQIHVLGYCYYEEVWKNVEYTGFIEPLAEFIEHLKQDENYVYNRASELNQYIDDYTEYVMKDIINEYFNGHAADRRLAYSDITIETPCGNYISN